MKKELTKEAQIRQEGILEGIEIARELINDKINEIDHLLYSDEAIQILIMSYGKKYDRLNAKRNEVQAKISGLIKASQTLYDLEKEMLK